MVEIPAASVKELRQQTSAGMMDCKRALVKAEGNKEKAVKILREQGIVTAEKKSTRTATEGIIACAHVDEGKTGSLVEINCETDFVSRNEKFKALAQELAEEACTTDSNLADTEQEKITAAIAEIGENIVIRRNTRLVLNNTGTIASYVHHDNSIGVLAEITCGKNETTENPTFRNLTKDVCLHIAALNPPYLDKNHVPEDVITAERDVYAKQFKDKPDKVIDKIVDGKMRKFYEEQCLIDQPFVKDEDKAVNDLLQETSSELDDDIKITRFVRYKVGEAPVATSFATEIDEVPISQR